MQYSVVFVNKTTTDSDTNDGAEREIRQQMADSRCRIEATREEKISISKGSAPFECVFHCRRRRLRRSAGSSLHNSTTSQISHTNLRLIQGDTDSVGCFCTFYRAERPEDVPWWDFQPSCTNRTIRFVTLNTRATTDWRIYFLHALAANSDEPSSRSFFLCGAEECRKQTFWKKLFFALLSAFVLRCWWMHLNQCDVGVSERCVFMGEHWQFIRWHISLMVDFMDFMDKTCFECSGSAMIIIYLLKWLEHWLID